MNTDTTPDGALLDLLHRDPIAEMETELGKGHHSEFDQDEQFACLGHAMALNQKKAAALKAAGDTQFHTPLDEYLRIVTDEGFSLVLKEPFVCEDKREDLYILWHPDGILLKFDTYGGDHVNGGDFYYNWKPKNPEEWFKNPEYHITSSGSWESGSGETPKSQWVWAGGHDCREALRLNLRELRRCGHFVCPWVNRPWLWLLHYADKKAEGYDHESINAKRIAKLPKHVQDAIRGEWKGTA